MSNKCQEYCDKLLADIVMARIAFESYKKTIEDEPEKEGIRNQFFWFSNRCYLYTFNMLLSKIYDYDCNSITLLKLLCSYEQTKPEKEIKEKIQQFRNSIISDNESNIKYLKTLRDKFYAHNDKILRPDELSKKAPLTIEKINTLLNQAENMLWYIYGYLNIGEAEIAHPIKNFAAADLDNIKEKLNNYGQLYEYYLKNNGLQVNIINPTETDDI